MEPTSGNAVAVDKWGNGFVTGSYQGWLTFRNPGGTPVQSLPGMAGHDMFLAKYDSAGVFKWAVRAGGPGTDAGNGVTVDADGNAYVTGGFSGTAAFESYPNIPFTSGSLVSANGIDTFVAKYDRNGQCLWTRSDGGQGDDAGTGIAWTPKPTGSAASTVFVTGIWGAGSAALSSPNQQMFLLRVGGDGSALARVLSSPVTTLDPLQSAKGRAVAVDRAGDAYVAGIIWGTTAFPGNTVPPPP